MAVVSLLSQISQEFKCPLTKDLLIDPYITNCNHVFENLTLTSYLRKHLKDENTCPICKERITSVEPHSALALRIQNEFTNISRANQEYFEKTKKILEKKYPKDITDPSLLADSFLHGTPVPFTLASGLDELGFLGVLQHLNKLFF
jgi:hypothetical protein